MPIYNVEDYLSTCVESILKQTYKNLEIILVDDGSPDSSGKMCDEFAEQDGRIRVVHKANAGLNMARKTGFDNSEGEWIIFIDSDDAFHPQAIEILIKAAKENLSDLAIGGYQRFLDDVDIVNKPALNNPKIAYEKDKNKAIHWLIRDSPYENVLMQTAWVKLFERHLIADIDWEYCNYRANEDEFMALQYYPKLTRGVAIVPENLYYYRINHSSITRRVYKNEFNGNLLSKFKTIEDLYQKSLNVFGKEFEEDILLRFVTQFLGFTEQYMREGHLGEDITKEYEMYFAPKIERISKIHDKLSQPYKDQFLAVKDKGVLGLIHHIIHYQSNHIQNIEHILQYRDMELGVLRQPGIKLAARKLAGAVKRRVSRTIRRND